jgi:hypothetical protein
MMLTGESVQLYMSNLYGDMVQAHRIVQEMYVQPSGYIKWFLLKKILVNMGPIWEV